MPLAFNLCQRQKGLRVKFTHIDTVEGPGSPMSIISVTKHLLNVKRVFGQNFMGSLCNALFVSANSTERRKLKHTKISTFPFHEILSRGGVIKQ